MEPAVIQPAKEDLYYFVRYLLWEECARVRPTKRRRTAYFESFWIRRQGGLPIRDSDLRERSYTCIEAMIRIARNSKNKAAAEVAELLGRKKSSDVEAIRVAYYEVRRTHRGRILPLSMWFMGFFSWRDWVLSSDIFTITFALQKYQERFGQLRARRLAFLMSEMRRDPVQAARNAVWHEAGRPGSECFVPEP